MGIHSTISTKQPNLCLSPFCITCCWLPDPRPDASGSPFSHCTPLTPPRPLRRRQRCPRPCSWLLLNPHHHQRRASEASPPLTATCEPPAAGDGRSVSTKRGLSVKTTRSAPLLQSFLLLSILLLLFIPSPSFLSFSSPPLRAIHSHHVLNPFSS
ncbi:hypothetical protein LIA77_00983 [Sarocladium implicatum]|nr:hypothetical protein LIA77_00983 [Sarocladium implicatum]